MENEKNPVDDNWAPMEIDTDDKLQEIWDAIVIEQQPSDPAPAAAGEAGPTQGTSSPKANNKAPESGYGSASPSISAAASPAASTNISYNTTPYDKSYFNSYASIRTHQMMLRDAVRTTTYRDAIFTDHKIFENRVVLDIGCGTGILSLFAAQAGAKRVIGIDMSDIAYTAMEIVKANGFQDVITIVKAKVEEIDKLPHGIETVDIIISEWMGHCLFKEAMLDTVLYARDRWLEEGLLYPDRASLYITAIDDRLCKEQKIDWFNNVYGFDMSLIARSRLRRPRITTINDRMLVTDSCLLIELDLDKVARSPDNFAFTRQFHLTAKRNDFFNAFATYFTVEFSCKYGKKWISTAPHAPYTHWGQTVFYFPEATAVNEGEFINGTFTMRPDEQYKRDISVTIKCDFDGESDSNHEEMRYAPAE